MQAPAHPKTRRSPRFLDYEGVSENDRRVSRYCVWNPVSTRYTVPDLFTITLVDDELRAFYPKYGYVVYTMRLDGKWYPLTAPNAAAGSGNMAEGVGLRTLRRITYQGQKATLEAVMDLSADGKAMTIMTRTPGSPDDRQ